MDEQKPIFPFAQPADVLDDLVDSIEDTGTTRLQQARATINKSSRFNPSTDNLENDLATLEKSFNFQRDEDAPLSGRDVPDFFWPEHMRSDEFVNQPLEKKFPAIKKEFFRGLMKCRIEEGFTTATEMIERRQRRDPRTAALLREIAEEEGFL